MKTSEFFLNLSFTMNKDDAILFALSGSVENVFSLALNSSLKTFKTLVTSQSFKSLKWWLIIKLKSLVLIEVRYK